MDAQEHIFLSYRAIEANFALQLAADFKNDGLRLWMDRLDGIKSGDDWRLSIEQALTKETCSAVIAVLSVDYINSEYCRNELARANRLQIPVYPVLLSHIPDEHWPIEIERIQFIDFREWQNNEIYQEKFSVLLKVIKGKFSSNFGPVPDHEIRYLNKLIAELESRKGVLEYVELISETEENIRPRPVDDEWGFSELNEVYDDTLGSSILRKVELPGIADGLKNHRCFVLVGNPGAGKSTALRRLARDAACKRMNNPKTEPLPVFLYLPQWKDNTEPIDFIKEHWPFSSDPGMLLSSGDIILFLDGLNEMGSAGLNKARKLNDWIQSPKGPGRIIITCRESDYTDTLKLSGLPVIKIHELTNEKIQLFSQNYLGEKSSPFLQLILKHTEKATDDKRTLSGLANNPYMLSALIYLYDNTPNNDIPHNMGKLFQKLTRALWKREQLRNTQGWMEFEKAEALFADLAFSMIRDKQAIDVPVEYVKKFIESTDLLYAAERANFIIVSKNNIRFYHQLIQEYFAAVKLDKTGISNVLEKQEYTLRYQYRLNRKWDEVVIALAGITVSPEKLIETVMRLDPYFISVIIKSQDHVAASTYKAAFEALLNLLPDPDWKIRVAGAEALGELGDKAAVPALIKLLKDEYYKEDGGGYEWKTIYPVRMMAAKALGKIADASAVPALIDAMNDPDNNWLIVYMGRTNAALEAKKALELIATADAFNAVRATNIS